ncbi:MAG TPA: amino acid adenylation domain-containing protein [Pyrinomonadaceae bacterium]|jgi:amino acid adenylation domain-containing protein
MSNQGRHDADWFSAEDRELLSILLEDEGVESRANPTPLRRAGRDRAPLSYAQQRLWFLDQWQKGLPVYNVTSAVRLRGRLDVEALERTLREVVRRHESLRTTFDLDEGGRPVQVVNEGLSVTLTLVDLTGLPGGEREQEARRQATLEARRPFDLARGPLLRPTLWRLGEEEHIALLVVHHIISDAWSMGVLLAEVSALYEALSAGEASPLPELPLQYADYAVWQRESLSDDVLRQRLAYWRERLAGVPKVLELPADRPRPPVQNFRGAKLGRGLPPALHEELSALSRREGATLYMTLLAAFLTLLARYTGQGDLAVGSPTAGRSRLELEGLIGFFVNTLVLRADASDDPSFLELLGRVKAAAIEAHDYEVPFEKLVEELRPERSLSHQPLIQVMFALQNTAAPSLELPGLSVSSYAVETASSRFDLTLSMVETPGALSATVEYSADLFDAATAGRMLESFETLLRGVVADPRRRISRLPLLPGEERRRLLSEWNATRPEEVRGVCLHELFEEQVGRTPDAVALSYEDERLTYRELNGRANRLARYLRGRGVGAESLVGVCVERSNEMVVALLGVLKAGGAYVPLDPAYPKDRLAFMTEDARAGVLITQRHLLPKLPGHTAEVVCLDADWGEIGRESEQNVEGASGPENVAYVIYTSGSTGSPKGVAVTHANVTRLFASTRRWYGFNESDVWTLFHSYAFDFSVWELWGALLYGGRLVIVPYLVSRTPGDFYRLLVEEGVTVLSQTPSAFRQLMQAEEEAGGAQSLSLRYVVFGGEALEFRDLKKWYARRADGPPRLVNMYGITETTVHVTYRPLRAADAQEDRALSLIGVRIPDLQLYILDPHMEPVPPGVPGEIYVGGAGLARGYLGRAGLTAERFVPHPFGEAHGARLYRTGDLARHLPDGDIEYLGRADEQVKIRGFRIEPGEIEGVLSGHEAVDEVLVVAREDAPGERRLVAYFVAAAGAGAGATDLRDYLKERLPDYMVPSAFVAVERMPLTPHGKIDRRALPAPDASRPELGTAYAAPRNEVEEALAAIWENVLGVERVGIHDNFFDLGGDSILSIRVLALAKERGINFSLQQLFQCQTVGALAGKLNLSEMDAAPAPRPAPFSLVNESDRAKMPGHVEDAYPLAMLQAGMLYHMAYEPGEMIYHNVYSYHLRARLDVEALRGALREVVARHAILRTSFDLTTYSEPLQLVHRTADFPIQVDDLLHVAPEEQERLLDEFVESEKWRRFDISRPPLLRFHIHRRTEETFNFTLTEFHPILDGWSLHSLLAEIFTSGLAARDQRPAPAPAPLSSSYSEFVRRERMALESEECGRYWRDKLRDVRPTELPRWPVAPPRPSLPRIVKGSYPLPAETSRGLRGLARALGVPLKSVLLAAHLKVLSVVCGRGDVVTGLVSGGRPEEADGEKVLGLFFNTLPFSSDVSAGTWRDLIQATFRAELEMLPYRRYPVAALQKQWGRRPLFESVFNYLHFHVLDDLAESGLVELAGPTRYWEETNLTLSTAFLLDTHTEQIILTLRYDTTQFGEAQIESVRGYYTRVLGAMVSGPEERHERRSFLDAGESRRLLTEWAVAPHARTERRCVHRLFEEQAEKTPEAVAVVYEDERLTYRELNARANLLARDLRARGVGPEVPVVVCLERSVESVVCLLGVLKAGGAYVPVEPGQPPRRIASMLAETGAPVLLTRQRFAAGLPAEGAAVVCVDAVLEGGAREGVRDPLSGVSPDNPAYLIFTSGSTGEPKAVAVEHRQLHNYVLGILERLGLTHPASYALASTFATDLGHTAIFPALLTGGTLHVLSAERLTNPEALAEYFDLHRPDCLKIVPTHLAALLAASPTSRILPRLRLILGGDVCRRELVEKVAGLAPDCVVFNHYGPTETTVGVLAHRLEPGREEGTPAAVALGRPLPGAEVYILDANMNPVPTATPGEIYVGGEGLARGYFKRPALTAERFVPHPYGERAGARLYRTGDVGRYLPDGAVEFLGRHDRQVKIRGYRVEPGEIEGVLCQHPAVERAVAVIDGEEHDRRVVAYVMVRREGGPTQGELRRHLREMLPDYAVPSAFVMLEEMPLTPSGKIDRAALPRADGPAQDSDAAYVGPRDEMERTIAGVWGDLLKVEKMGVHDNFFDLGGHSLILLRMQSKLREILRRDIAIVEIFEHPTISSLARHLNRATPEPETFRRAREEAAARREALERRSRRGTAAR